MEIKNSYLIIGFLLMFGVLVYSLYNISVFMPAYEECKDDFEVIDKCNCLPQDYPNVFPGYVKNKTIVIPNG